MLRNQHHLLHWERLGIYLIMVSSIPTNLAKSEWYLTVQQKLMGNFLTGPDLTNQLIGVLIQFLEEHVAIMADIEAMFYQVKVAEKHRSFLRFL